MDGIYVLQCLSHTVLLSTYFYRHLTDQEIGTFHFLMYPKYSESPSKVCTYQK